MDKGVVVGIPSSRSCWEQACHCRSALEQHLGAVVGMQREREQEPSVCESSSVSGGCGGETR